MPADSSLDIIYLKSCLGGIVRVFRTQKSSSSSTTSASDNERTLTSSRARKGYRMNGPAGRESAINLGSL